MISDRGGTTTRFSRAGAGAGFGCAGVPAWDGDGAGAGVLADFQYRGADVIVLFSSSNGAVDTVARCQLALLQASADAGRVWGLDGRRGPASRGS